jgi:hypothetical protein
MGNSRSRVRRIDVTHHCFGSFDRPRRAAVQARFALGTDDEPQITKGEVLTEEPDCIED